MKLFVVTNTTWEICKSQRTNQCHSLRTLYWFVLCNLLIFSGCVCHLEQLHAQSPFLFPIVFGINLIPFFDICSVDYLLLGMHTGMCCFTRAAARSQQFLFVVLAAGLWYFTAGCHVKSPLFPNPLSNRSVLELHDGRKHKTKAIRCAAGLAGIPQLDWWGSDMSPRDKNRPYA